MLAALGIKPDAHVLCFGDSLTEGFPSGNAYCEELQRRLARSSAHARVQVEQHGVSGELVREIHDRWRERAKPSAGVKPVGECLVVLLAGTNDLGSVPARGQADTRVPRIIAALREFGDAIVSSGAALLLVTIPCTQFDNEADYVCARVVINAWIRRHTSGTDAPVVATTGAGAPPAPSAADEAVAAAERLIGAQSAQLSARVRWMELERVLPYSRDIYTDGLHFSRAGYDRFGGLVADVLLGPSSSSSPSAASATGSSAL